MGKGIQAGKVAGAIYIHIPYCIQKCHYCAFYSEPFTHDRLHEYHEFLLREIDLYRDWIDPLALGGSIYFGGGTPSLLSAQQINSLVAKLYPKLSYDTLKAEYEITLEVNPIQINKSYLQQLKHTPINRLSIGIQSMDDDELLYLGRRHRTESLKERIELCRDYGYDNISVDIIYGLPKAKPMQLKQNITRLLELSPDHISAYLLNAEEHTPLWDQRNSLPDDDTCADLYELLCEELSCAGYEHYEISSFCAENKRSRHNLCYWRSANYLAFGASAAGQLLPHRYQNPASIADYYAGIERQLCFPNRQLLSLEQQQADYLMMGLRCCDGISLSDFQARFGYSLLEYTGSRLESLLDRGVMSMLGDRISICKEYRFVSNSVLGELL